MAEGLVNFSDSDNDKDNHAHDWVDTLSHTARDLCHLYKVNVAHCAVQSLSEGDHEILWNVLNNLSFLSSELAGVLKLPQKKRRRRRRKKTATQKNRKRSRRVRPPAADGWCDGCERVMTGKEAVAWRRGDVIGRDDASGILIRQHLCNSCGCKRRRRNLKKSLCDPAEKNT